MRAQTIMFSHVFMGAVIVALVGFFAYTFTDCRKAPFDGRTVCVFTPPR